MGASVAGRARCLSRVLSTHTSCVACASAIKDGEPILFSTWFVAFFTHGNITHCRLIVRRLDIKLNIFVRLVVRRPQSPVKSPT